MTAAVNPTAASAGVFGEFAALLGKWSGDCHLVDLTCPPSPSSASSAASPPAAPTTTTTTTLLPRESNAVITVKAALSSTATPAELELRLSCTTSDGLTSKEEFTFAAANTAAAAAANTILRCSRYTGAKYAPAGITLQAEGQGLYLLKVTLPSEGQGGGQQNAAAAGYLRVQTFHVSSCGEFVSSWQTFDLAPGVGAKAPRQLSGVGIFKASQVPSANA